MNETFDEYNLWSYRCKFESIMIQLIKKAAKKYFTNIFHQPFDFSFKYSLSQIVYSVIDIIKLVLHNNVGNYNSLMLTLFLSFFFLNFCWNIIAIPVSH